MASWMIITISQILTFLIYNSLQNINPSVRLSQHPTMRLSGNREILTLDSLSLSHVLAFICRITWLIWCKPGSIQNLQLPFWNVFNFFEKLEYSGRRPENLNFVGCRFLYRIVRFCRTWRKTFKRAQAALGTRPLLTLHGPVLPLSSTAHRKICCPFFGPRDLQKDDFGAWQGAKIHFRKELLFPERVTIAPDKKYCS